MPEWIHNRAMHILAKNPEMGKSQAFAIATQQGHATGHTPKDFGTSKGKHEAKAKYDEPKKSYEQTADAGSVGKKLERAEDRGDVNIKQASRKAVIAGLKRIQADDVIRGYRAARSKKSSKTKEAGRLGALVGSLVAPEQHKQIKELRGELDSLKSVLPKKLTKKLEAAQTKQASLMLESLDSIVIGAFCDELEKIASTKHAALPGTPTGLTEIKSTIPTKPLSGKTPKYSKVNSDPGTSPMIGTQPLSDPPPTRA